MLPKNLTNYDTFIRKLLKNGMSGNILLPPPARQLATEMFHVWSVIPPPQSQSIRHWAWDPIGRCSFVVLFKTPARP
jgi:hypothetical protein